MYIKGMKNCRLCELCKTRMHVLKGEGDPRAGIMLIAHAPGEQEDRENRMFIGPSGKILDMLLEEAGISRSRIYITNLLKCRLSKNRRPKLKEIAACSIWLEAEIKRVKPALIAPLGYYATKYMFETHGLGTFIREVYLGLIGVLCPAPDFALFPLTHPTILIHNQEYIPASVKNFKSLKDYVAQRM
jgi:DNA polymerase